MNKIILVVTLLICMVACTKRKAEKLNEHLYDEIANSTLTFYQGIDSVYAPAGGSPHGNFRLKFNSIAAAALTDGGRLPVGGEFPEGSLIVKEVMTGTSVALYAIMRKDSQSKFRSGGNWLWGEYLPSGDANVSAGDKGVQCTSCHSSGTNRDLVRSFDLH